MIILVTGGSSGLGESITRRLAQDVNSTVYFTYNQSITNAEKIQSAFPNAIPIKCNFRNETDVTALSEQIIKLDIDILINNVYFGEAIKTYFHKIPVDDFLTDFKENLVPTISITQVAINCFRKKKFGKIITILTSFLINTPPTGSSVYVANKAYLEELSKIWAVENAKYNIVSNCISPSFMLTDFTKDVDDRVIEQMKENHPLKKLLTTQEVAESVFFLSQSTQQINGLNIIINSASSIK